MQLPRAKLIEIRNHQHNAAFAVRRLKRKSFDRVATGSGARSCSNKLITKEAQVVSRYRSLIVCNIMLMELCCEAVSQVFFGVEIGVTHKGQNQLSVFGILVLLFF